jgi:hypothetical protein
MDERCHQEMMERHGMQGFQWEGVHLRMATILDLSEYRARTGARRSDSPPRQAGVKPVPHYFCTRCETDRFKLFSTGTVHCAQCSALMRNISVAESSKDASGSK